MGEHHLPHELSQLYTCEVFTMRINTVTESAGLDVMEIMFPAHPVDVDNFSDFRKFVFCPGAVACFIRDAIFSGHCEFPACGRTVFVNRAICVFTGGADQSDTSGIFLIGAAHTAMKRRYLLSETDRDVSASIIGFSPVKRDAEKCTTSTTRHAWIRIAHFHTICCFFKRSDKRAMKKTFSKIRL